MQDIGTDDEVELCEREDTVAVEGGLEGEVVALERFRRIEPRGLQRDGFAAGLACGKLLGQQPSSASRAESSPRSKWRRDPGGRLGQSQRHRLAMRRSGAALLVAVKQRRGDQVKLASSLAAKSNNSFDSLGSDEVRHLRGVPARAREATQIVAAESRLTSITAPMENSTRFPWCITRWWQTDPPRGSVSVRGRGRVLRFSREPGDARFRMVPPFWACPVATHRQVTREARRAILAVLISHSPLARQFELCNA